MEKANFPPPKKTTFLNMSAFETMNDLLSYCTSFSSFLQFLKGRSSFKFLPCLVDQFAQVFRHFWRHTRNTRVCSTPPGVAGSLRREFSCRGWTFEWFNFHGRCPANTETSIESRWGYPSLRHRSIQDQRCWWQLKKGSSPVMLVCGLYNVSLRGGTFVWPLVFVYFYVYP